MIPVLRHAQIRSWPTHEEGGAATPTPLATALTTPYSTDAHCQACLSPDIPRRLSSDALGQTDITMQAAIFDVDGPDHKADDAWWADLLTRTASLAVDHPAPFVYRTRGGARIVYRLGQQLTDATAWRRMYLAWTYYLARLYGITADRACADWTRVFRLPHATRDEGGTPEQLDTHGDASSIGPWDCTPSDLDYLQADAYMAPERTPATPKPRSTVTPPPAGTWVLRSLLAAGVLRELPTGATAVRCPWANQHTTDTGDSSTVIFPPTAGDSLGAFRCLHAHCDRRRASDVLALFSPDDIARANGRTPQPRHHCPPPLTDADAPDWIVDESFPEEWLPPPPAQPQIRLSHQYQPGEGHRAVECAVRALAQDPTVYVRGGSLVSIARASLATPDETDEETPGPNRHPDAPVIFAISSGRLWEHLSRLVAWEKQKKEDWTPTDPPDRVVTATHSRGDWPGVRNLLGVVTSPVLRPDGSLVTTPGYDPETSLFYAPTGPVAPVPDHPTLDDARAASQALIDVVQDFPFTPGSRTAWLAALLSPVAFPAYPGNAPMFVFDATKAGSGKSLLADVIGIIATGQRMAGSPYVADDDEMRKRITAHALAGDFCVLVDNVPNGGRIGWPSLDMALTRGSINDRVLGKSENARIRLAQCWYATGNNPSVKGDAGRRTIKARLEAAQENPHERPQATFRYPDLIGHVTANRPRLLSAALTIVRAFIRAGARPQGDTALGSFEGWSRTVRDALVWANIGDPLDQSASRDPDADPDAGAHVAAIEALDYLDSTGGGLTAAEIVAALNEQHCRPTARSAFAELCPSRGRGDRYGLPSATDLGWKLRALRGMWRACEGGRVGAIDRPERGNHRTGVARWCVKWR